eukprot:scaffold18862_cov63-Phaeocystis_antarctica.AAC.2
MVSVGAEAGVHGAGERWWRRLVCWVRGRPLAQLHDGVGEHGWGWGRVHRPLMMGLMRPHLRRPTRWQHPSRVEGCSHRGMHAWWQHA